MSTNNKTKTRTCGWCRAFLIHDQKYPFCNDACMSMNAQVGHTLCGHCRVLLVPGRTYTTGNAYLDSAYLKYCSKECFSQNIYVETPEAMAERLKREDADAAAARAEHDRDPDAYVRRLKAQRASDRTRRLLDQTQETMAVIKEVSEIKKRAAGLAAEASAAAAAGQGDRARALRATVANLLAEAAAREEGELVIAKENAELPKAYRQMDDGVSDV